ncbi:MAG: DNA helicase [Pseudomonadota bacterium]
MQFSAPIYALKRRAKQMARETDLALHQALDTVAQQEGHQSWAHLAASWSIDTPTQSVLSCLEPGDLCLIAARPGHGKTRLGLDLVSKASRIGRTGFFFTLDYHERDVADHLHALGVDLRSPQDGPVIDTSDDVSADYLIRCLSGETAPTLTVVDYLQVLDQKRSNPSLQDQMTALHRFVADTNGMCLVISQIDRSFDLAGKDMPDITDIRLPNPLDLSVFSKVFFLHNGEFCYDVAA